MIRLDKFLSGAGYGTRSQVKELIRKGSVTIDGMPALRPEEKVAEDSRQICVDGIPCEYEKYRYYMLHKPAGVLSAAEDAKEQTVLELLPEHLRKDLFPVGRLDRDTTGLLLLTNDGALAHDLLSPAKHVAKTYLVKTREPVPEQALQALRQGVDIGEKRKTMPAEASCADGNNTILLSIREGKYHQVKRMLQAVGHQVIYLKRLSMGPLVLDETLPEGCFRRLSEAEVELLKTAKKSLN